MGVYRWGVVWGEGSKWAIVRGIEGEPKKQTLGGLRT